MAIVSMKALLESGVHFGHRTNKWDPHMKPYIFTERNGIHIIDLQQTVKLLNQAYAVVRNTIASGGSVLFVGTKRQAQETIAEEAARCGMPYVNERWMGGMLTNWNTISQRVQQLDRLERMGETGEMSRKTKKESLMIGREIARLKTRLSGISTMKNLPDLLFIVDIGREDGAVHEAKLLNIPVVALVDTNCNPRDIDYIIPSNDDAIRAIKLLVGKMADAVLEGKAMRKDEESEEALAAQDTAVSVSRQPVRTMDDDDELADDALLGTATLAKLSKPEADAEPDPEAKVVEQTSEETVEEPAEKPVAETVAEEPAEEPVVEPTEEIAEEPKTEEE